MKSSLDRHEVTNLRWRGNLDTDAPEWSPGHRWLLVILLIIALLV
ncbi:hypothetical protein [Sporomusa sphaeroides]